VRPSRLNLRTILIALAALVVFGAAVFAVAALLSGGGGGGTDAIAPVSLSRSELESRSGDLAHTAYWAGPRPHTAYELTQTEDARIYVRYLTRGAPAGSPNPAYLTVGTYPVSNAAGILAANAATGGGGLAHPDSRTVVPGQRNNAYVVFDSDPNLQIEIYSPKPGEALRLARSPALRPLP
jgi:hypothetical protein